MPLGLSLFALLLLAKVILNVHITHYSFALAMPAAMLMIVAAWDWAPRAIERLGGSSFMLRGAFLGALLIAVPRCLAAVQREIRLSVRAGRIGGGRLRRRFSR